MRKAKMYALFKAQTRKMTPYSRENQKLSTLNRFANNVQDTSVLTDDLSLF